MKPNYNALQTDEIPIDDSQYLLETVGVLVSIESLTKQEQVSFLSSVTDPILFQLNELRLSTSVGDIRFLCTLVASIGMRFLYLAIIHSGALSKGFPDYQSITNKATECTHIFCRVIETLVGILELRKMTPGIRDAVNELII